MPSILLKEVAEEVVHTADLVPVTFLIHLQTFPSTFPHLSDSSVRQIIGVRIHLFENARLREIRQAINLNVDLLRDGTVKKFPSSRSALRTWLLYSIVLQLFVSERKTERETENGQL